MAQAKPAIEPLKAVKVGMMSKGDGVNKPKKGDVLHVTYIGRFHGGQRHGQVFDHTKDTPFSFTLGYRQVIRGWDAGFKHLSLGTKAMLQIPSQYAYGDTGVANPEYKKKKKKTKNKGKNKNKNKDKNNDLFEQYAIPPKQDLAFEVQLLGINDMRWQEPKQKPKREPKQQTKQETKKSSNESKEKTNNSNVNPNENDNNKNPNLESQGKPKVDNPQNDDNANANDDNNSNETNEDSKKKSAKPASTE